MKRRIMFMVIALFLINSDAFSQNLEQKSSREQGACVAEQNAAIDRLVADCLKKGVAIGKCEIELTVRASVVRRKCKLDYGSCHYWISLYAVDHGMPIQELNQLIKGCL